MKTINFWRALNKASKKRRVVYIVSRFAIPIMRTSDDKIIGTTLKVGKRRVHLTFNPV